MCNYINAQSNTETWFDEVTGYYNFYSTDKMMFPPGDYVFEVTGTVGDISDSAQFTLTLSDPCEAGLIQLKPSPFEDRTYVLGSDPKAIE